MKVLPSTILFLFVSFAGITQQLPATKLTLEFNNTSLPQALEIISQKTGVSFSYNPKKFSPDLKFSYHADSKSLTEVLNDLSQVIGMKYSLVENQIVLKPNKKIDEAKNKSVTLSGYIRDGATGEALIGATIYIQSLAAGTVANAYGFYSITVPKGSYEVSYSFMGYEGMQKTVNLEASVAEQIRLTESAPVLQEVIVRDSARGYDEEIVTSKVSLRPNMVGQRPALFGEMDVIKSLESVPGIKPHSDGSTFYYVRGGGRDQNLVMVDDAPIYNPAHLLGFFSTIIPDVVNDINVYKGDMPASLSGRISSVLEVHTKKGNDRQVQAWGNAGLISTKLGIEGPIKKETSSFLISGRVSRLKWFFQGLDPNVKQFQFYDLTGKLNFRLQNRDRIYFSFYTGGDNYFYTNQGISWINRAATLGWNHIITNRLFLNTTASVSSYDYDLFSDVSTDTKWHSHISNFNLKTDFSYFIKPQSELRFGAAIAGYNFNPGNMESTINTSSPQLSVRNSSELVLYGQHEIQLNQQWGMSYGLRLSSWTDLGEAFEFVYDDLHKPIDTLYFKKGEKYKTYGRAEPRVTIKYTLPHHASVKASYSHNIQNIHILSNSTSPFTSVEVWLPSSINIKPQAADQLSIGYYRTFTRSGISFMTESFYKKLYNQIGYTDHASTLLNPLLEGQLRFGTGTAYGVEFQVKKDEGRLRGWAGYSYARAKRQFEEVNGGRSFNAFCDRPHQINFVVVYDVSLRWNLGLNWNYYTGAPFSSPVSFFRYNGLEVPVYDQRNNNRLPDYHRLDFSATFRLNKNPEKKFQHHLSFSVFNVYGRKNVLFINYNKAEDTNGDFKISSSLPVTESVMSQLYLFKFTPSISYNFRWL